MKAVIMVPWGANLGGAETMLWTFLSRLDRDRLDPLVVFLTPGPFERDVAGLGLRTVVVPIGRLRQPVRVVRAVWALSRLIRHERPAVIVNWVAKAQLYGAVAAVLASSRRRIVWWQHGVPAGHWMDRLASALPAQAVGCSSHAAAAAQMTVFPHRPTFVVHPGVEPVEPAPAARGPLAHDDTCTLGIVGRLQPWKGQHVFLRAVAELRRRGHAVRGLVVGGTAHGFSAGYDDQLRRLAAELDLADNVTFTGQVDDPSPFFRQMDILVSASTNEPFGIVLLEGMAHGLPLVAVGDAGPAEIVVPGRTGSLVDRPDPTLIADALEALLTDPDLRAQMGERARERMLGSFSADRMAVAIHDQLESIVGPAVR